MEHSMPNRMNNAFAAASIAWGLTLILAGFAPEAFADEAAAIAPSVSTDASDATHAITPDVATASAPEDAVEMFHTGLIQIMKDAKEIGFQGRIDRLSPLMAETFDLDFMASKTVGRHWKKLSDADKERWTTTFARFTTANYAGRFTGYTGEQFITNGVEEAAKGTQVVLTKIVIPDEEDVQLNYRVIQKNGEWRVIDVYLNGTVSELALRRSEYSSALKRSGFDQLCQSVESKIEDLKSKGQVDG